MGIGPGAFNELAELSRRFTPRGRSLMLGRQSFRLGQGAQRGAVEAPIYQKILAAHGLDLDAGALRQDDHFSETMFERLGFGRVEALDYSDYQGAALVWDLNRPVPEDWHGQFGFIYDGGTLEHVFNVPQAFANVFNMLAEDGVFVAANPYNGYPSHGMYQFSPELAWTYWKHSCDCELRTCRAVDPKGRFRQDLPDPVDLGGRVPVKLGARWRGRMPAGPVLLWYETVKTARAHLPRDVLQSDYVATWTQTGATTGARAEEAVT